MAEAPEQTRNLFFDLSARTKLRLTGADRVRFLNGQITNDATEASPGQVVLACVLNAKGRMDGLILLSASDDAFILDTDPELRGQLQTRLERYAISDQVEITDISGDFALFHVLGAGRPALPESCRVAKCERFRQPGWDIWTDMTGHDTIFSIISTTNTFCDDAGMEVFRIERGVGRWNREWTSEIIPVEAGLEEQAIDYEKGCYIGQEVISRMKMSGQKNKKLGGFVSLSGVPLEAGMKLLPIGQGAKDAGWVTSAARSKMLGKEIALGYMKRPFFHAGFRLDAIRPDEPERPPVRVEVADIPFPGAASGT